MERFNLYLISAIFVVLLGMFSAGWLFGKKQYEQGMTDTISLCYDMQQAIIQSKQTGKTIVCAALTDKQPL